MAFLPPLDARNSLALAVIFLAILIYLALRRRRRQLPFPPGPKGLPFLGNIHDVPLEREWLTYSQWAKDYGPVVSVHVFGQRVVLLNSPELCRELLESRAAIYSNRPHAPMLNMMGYGSWLVGLLQPSQRWMTCRKVLAQNFNPKAVHKWHPNVQYEVHRLLVKLLEDPGKFYHHIDRTVVGFFMMTLYGHRVPMSGEDDFVAIHDKSLRETSRAISSGAYLVNIFPRFRHVPEWMIGGGFHKDAREAFATCQQVLHKPVEKIKQEMANGKAPLSYVMSLLAEGQDESAIKQTAATAYNAGVTGTRSIILTSIMVMTLFPEAQRKAQQEIDRVCGKDRLPSFEDRSKLPYTEAFVKELFRWAPPAPVGLPRCLAKDDVIQNYFIPAGSLLMTNMWEILHDENRYHQPFEFIPERHLDAIGHCPDPSIEGFGFGKRACPGRHIVNEFTWLAVVSILAAFKIRKEIDSEGREISPQVEYSTGLFSAPKPFNSNIKARSRALEQMIRHLGDHQEAPK